MRTADFGYSGIEFLQLGETAWTRYDEKIFEHTEENDRLMEKLDILKDAISMLNKDKEQLAKIDYTKDPEKRKIIDKVREIAPQSIDGNLYSFKKEQVESYLENLRTHASQFTSRLNLPMMMMTQLFQERNRIEEIVGEITKMYRQEMEHYVQNQKR